MNVEMQLKMDSEFIQVQRNVTGEKQVKTMNLNMMKMVLHIV
jgi:hypothetical protein